MADRSHPQHPQPTPVTADATATAPQLLARAAQDLAAARDAAAKKQQQGAGQRQGILPGGTR